MMETYSRLTYAYMARKHIGFWDHLCLNPKLDSGIFQWYIAGSTTLDNPDWYVLLVGLTQDYT